MAALVRLVAALAVAGAAAAEPLVDPTRPPAGYGAAAAAAPATPAPPRLTMIVRGPDDRYRAVIDGRSVRVGDVVGGARVDRITDHAVVLARDGARTTLELLPEAARAVRPRAADRPHGRD
ncbi:MAG: MSHA biogenesis protein MshK [Burkholderiaceae bacterium]|nr:MSHA biogenesis protein MshK [Burkholderiaceae bacterium]